MLINEPTLSERKSLDDKLIVKDWNYSIQLNRLFLKSIGAWPLSLTVTLFDKIISISLTTISICLIGFLFLPCALVTFLGKENDLDAKIKMIGPFSFCAMAAIKYYILTSRGLDIAKCIKHIRTDWEHVSNAKKQ
ncbi:hypothetical protein M0802_007277 [Mischocyttarus mexicanus]|nr:hypothetical protein M0802_007277 [Mischocyttarus mexicanus]